MKSYETSTQMNTIRMINNTWNGLGEKMRDDISTTNMIGLTELKNSETTFTFLH